MPTIIYSHGFGVTADFGQLLPDIADSLPDFNHDMFDYNVLNPRASNMTITPLDQQVDMLNRHLAQARDLAYIICHSQGCVVAAMANYAAAKRIIFLAPPDYTSQDRLIKTFGSRPGAVINTTGMSSIPRNSGITTLIPADYWVSLREIDNASLYRQVSETVPLTIIRAARDERLNSTDFSYLDKATLLSIDADHNFTGAARPRLLNAVMRVVSIA